MSALVSTCDVASSGGSNTGFENECVLGIAKGLIMVPASWSAEEADFADPVEFLRTKIHAAGTARFYPVLQGIFDFSVTREGDVTEANPVAGTTRVIRLGGLTITYTFEKGGLCLAQALLGFFQKGYSFIPVDSESKFLLRENADGTYSGLKSSEVTPNFSPATSTTSFKNILVVSTSYDEYVRYSKLFKSDTSIEFKGLIDTEILKAAAGSTTKLKIWVKTHCAGTDLIAEYPTELPLVANFSVTNKLTGATVVPTAAAIVGGLIELTGTYVSGQTYVVAGAAPSVWLANDIEGFDASSNSVEITIP